MAAVVRRGWLLGAAMGWLLAGAGASAVAAEEGPPLPKPLACYRRMYGLTSELRDGRWYLLLPSGERLLYDDGKAKSPEARLAHPDVEDQFATPYLTGPPLLESAAERDPGRVRVTAILRAIYPNAATEVVKVGWFGAQLRVHRRIASAIERVASRIALALGRDPSLRPWLERPGGGYAYRPIAGTDRLSAHSFGIAVDINPKRSEYWRWEGASGRARAFARPVPAPIVEAFESEGFIWGGRWYHYDTMHFEYRPELLDRSCQP